MKNKWSIIVLFLCIVLIALIGFKWNTEHRGYVPNQNQLINSEEVVAFLNENHIDVDSTETSRVGLLIESLAFETSYDVEVSGYIWQTMDTAISNDEKWGITFPDAIGGVTLEEKHTEIKDGEQTTVWYFEAVLREQFKYVKYPLDHKTIWIRILPEDFISDMVILPDYSSYPSTGLNDSFGIDESLVLDGWSLTETFYDYSFESNTTSFGLENSTINSNKPVMQYNIVIERDFMQAAFVNLSMMLVVMILLYSLVLMITSEEEKLLDLFGMSASGAIGTCAALFFSVLVAHIDLRSMFGGQLVYIELFYYLTYLFILVVSAIVFMFMQEVKNNNHPLIASNAKLLKLLYWPVYLGLIYIITLLWL